jgi:hypothetical protein
MGLLKPLLREIWKELHTRMTAQKPVNNIIESISNSAIVVVLLSVLLAFGRLFYIYLLSHCHRVFSISLDLAVAADVV